MNEENRVRLSGQNSPRVDRNMRSKSRLGAGRQSRPIYLTDGQFSSSDHTNISSSQINILKIEYQSKIRKVQRENKELKQTIVSLKATQFYELDQQKIKGVIRENQSLKLRIVQFEGDIKILDEEVSALMVQNQYLKRNNKALKQDMQKLIKQSIRQKHNYYTSSNKSKTNPISYGDDDYQQDPSKHESRQMEKQAQRSQMVRLLNKKKATPNDMQRQKVTENQQSVELQDKSKKVRTRNKSRYRSSSKSGEKGLASSFMGSKALLKRPVKQTPQISSTAQSQNLRHYSSSGNLLNLRGQNRPRQPKMLTSRSPNPYELQNQYTSRKKVDEPLATDYNGQYFAAKRQKNMASKKKKSLYYN